ncbi:DUF5694 domain-containing protein [Flavihumibacter profundi]|uniref:DUF5694 domain-containing protein n=1 Tax=Flavihumibacter profundi TaxID=2716883 RepID=UPI001CC82180|nr:DUF5694 domain-containing protein [Flavihumibacter profundi]MBZ5858125.1 DUF5694 domain-containing protein [Flavihumibacter profundi]
MIARIIACVLFLSPILSTAQKINWPAINNTKSDKVLYADGYQPVKTLLLGTFHFDYPNLDAHKIDSSKMINILDTRRQQEVRQVVEVLKQMKPTRIYVEAKKQSKLDSLYNAYLSGNYTLGRDEIDQLAFRLAKESGVKKLYAVDASNFAEDHEKEYPWIDSLWNQSIPVDSTLDKKWNTDYAKLYATGDSLELKMTILESLLVTANRANMQRMHGHYLSVGFNTTDEKGPDALSIWWFNRNLRIFNKILQTKPKSEDRILVIFGAGHIPILRQCFESSPQFEIVELEQLARQYEQLSTQKKL